MGGGFGGKEDIAGQAHVALLSEATNRPVKMLYSRQESLLFHPKRHATVIRIRTGATREGRLTAVEATLYGDGGAYASLSEKVLTRATTHASGPYRWRPWSERATGARAFRRCRTWPSPSRDRDAIRRRTATFACWR